MYYDPPMYFTTQNNGGGESFVISVSANPGDGGMVSGGGTYDQGQSCTVSATANTGYTFANWTENGNVVSTDANYTFTVSSNRSLVANFTANGGGGGGGGGNAPAGALNGLFTINENGDQVYFSQGNLQYQVSTNTWRFADNQWNYVGGADQYDVFNGNVSGSSNNDISSTYSGWIDLFGWGTSGYNHGANCYQPWSTSNYSSDYYAYGEYTYNLYDQTGLADWGSNAISNGCNTENYGWRTLTREEWRYVLNERITSSGIHFAKAQVNGTNGVILLPDDWDPSYYSLNDTDMNVFNGYANNIITIEQWMVLEQHAAVFLPAAGARFTYSNDILLYDIGSFGYYWTSSCWDDTHACGINFGANIFNMVSCLRERGASVRLVCPAEH